MRHVKADKHNEVWRGQALTVHSTAAQSHVCAPTLGMMGGPLGTTPSRRVPREIRLARWLQLVDPRQQQRSGTSTPDLHDGRDLISSMGELCSIRLVATLRSTHHHAAAG